MRLALSILFILCFTALFGQVDPLAKPSRPLTLRERYQELRTGSETYNEYKVIKSYKLDQEWKVFLDSIEAVRAGLRSSRAEVARIENNLKQVQDTLRAKEASIAPLEVAGTHINFMGIDFRKGVFITTILLVIGGLAFLAGVMAWRLKGMKDSLNDRVHVINELNQEFDEYKRKALDKQTKLSRELQNERNRLAESKKP